MIRLLKAVGSARPALAGACAFSLLAVAACESPSVPEGTPGTVEVRAFIDQNGSGDFTPGTDTPVAGLSISLVGADGGQAGSASTGSDGVASFTGIRPGGYGVEFSGSAPEGALLASGTRPSVSVPAQGGTVQARFRFVSTPGNITGLIYRDVDDSGSFDPAVDEAGEGFLVELFPGEEPVGEATAQMTTGADGTYTFDFLRPGSWTVQVTPPAPLELVGDGVRTLTVSAGATASADFLFEGDLLLSIAEARQLAVGSRVTVEGVVTAAQNTWNPREAFVQDETGGILVFVRAGQSPALQIGDRVQVSGELGAFNGNIQITENPDIEFLGVMAPPEPRLITGEEMLARTFEGELVVLPGFTVDSLDVQNFDNHDVFGVTNDGSQVRIRVDSRSGVASTDWTVGATYQVTGLLRVFNGVPQLFPRSTDDFFIEGGDLTVAQARALPVGTPATVRGIVTVDQPAFGGRNIFVQDETGGILVFLAAADSGLGLVLGDEVTVSGERGVFNGEAQITGNPAVEIVGPGTPPAPRAVTGQDMLRRTFEGQVASLGVVTVDDLVVQNFDNHNVFVTTADGSEVVVRVDSRTGVGSARWTVGEEYEVSGLLRVFNGLPQLFPRQPADVVDAPAGSLVQAARFLASPSLSSEVLR